MAKKILGWLCLLAFIVSPVVVFYFEYEGVDKSNAWPQLVIFYVTVVGVVVFVVRRRN